MNIDILFEDDYILVVKKPFGLLTQKSSSILEDDLYSKVTKHYNNNYIGLIHRLDRPVGGVVILSKNKQISKILSDDFKNYKISKKYKAVVLGDAKEEDYLEDYLMKNQRLNISKIVNKNSPNSKLARLSYKKINTAIHNNQIMSLIEVTLLTGRHHQIRSQLSNTGLPIYGDTKYNKDLRYSKPLGYIGLWSSDLEITHPVTKKACKFHVEPDNVFPFNMF